jgi:hypothetical protein
MPDETHDRLQFLLTLPLEASAHVLVRWDKPLDTPRSGRYNLLHDAFELIAGVEIVEMFRYHAKLHYNTDITTAKEVVRDTLTLLEDSWVAEELKQVWPVVEAVAIPGVT